MNEAIAILTNKSRLVAATKDLTIEHLDDAIHKLSTVVEEKRREQEAQRAQAAQRAELVADYSRRMAEDGISVSDLLDTAFPKKASRRTPRSAKYKFTAADGSTKTWTGQGRQPKEIAAAIAAGAELDSFLIHAAED